MTGRVAAIGLVFVASALLAGSAEAQGSAPTVQVQVERSTVTVGEPFWVRITVVSQGNSAMISLPQGSPFELLGRGSTSSSVQMSSDFSGNMQISRQESTRWQVRATRAGRLTLGPMVLQIDGQQYRAGTATVEVVQGAPGASPPPQPQPQPPQAFPGLPPSTLSGMPVGPQPGQPLEPAGPGQLSGQIEEDALDGAVFDNELFVRTVVEPEEAYVGQQVVMTVLLYTTVNLSNVSVNREASTDGFWSEDLLGPSRRLTFQDQFIGQRPFRVAELRRLALFPLREGTLTIGAPQLEAMTGFRSLFSRRSGSLVRQGVPVQVRVRPLPEEGRPDDFNRGNVGRFEIDSRVDRQTSKVGEPVTLTLTVRGEGNLKNVKLPPIGEIEGARVYEPRVNDAVVTQGGKLGGERRWEVLILPQKTGRLELPSVELDYFDPIDGIYKSARTKSLAVEVSAGAGGAASQSSGATPGEPGVESSPRDAGELGPLRSIQRQSSLSTGRRPVYGAWWFFLLLVAAPAGFVTLLVVQRVRHRREAMAGAIRARRAAPVAKKAFAQVSSGDEGLGQVTRGFNGFFLDRFGQSATGQTMEELRAFVAQRGASPELAERVVQLMERCERGRFGGGGGDLDASGLAGEASAVVDELDRLVAPEGGKPGGER